MHARTYASMYIYIDVYMHKQDKEKGPLDFSYKLKITYECIGTNCSARIVLKRKHVVHTVL